MVQRIKYLKRIILLLFGIQLTCIIYSFLTFPTYLENDLDMSMNRSIHKGIYYNRQFKTPGSTPKRKSSKIKMPTNQVASSQRMSVRVNPIIRKVKSLTPTKVALPSKTDLDGLPWTQKIALITPAIPLKVDSELAAKTQEVLWAVRKNTSDILYPLEKTIIFDPPTLSSCEIHDTRKFLLVMIISSPENAQRRALFRELYKDGALGWQSLIVSHNNSFLAKEQAMNLLFFVGLSEDNRTNHEVLHEGKVHGDLIVDDFKEAYLNLTLKTLRMLKWVNTGCFRRVTYLAKVDDDMLLNVPKLLYFLFSYNSKATPGRYLISGYKKKGIVIVNDPNDKSFTPNSLWPEIKYPDFISGGFYVLGSQARVALYKAALRTRMFHLEDVFLTGMARLQIPFSNHYPLVHLPGVYMIDRKHCYFGDFIAMQPVFADISNCYRYCLWNNPISDFIKIKANANRSSSNNNMYSSFISFSVGFLFYFYNLLIKD